MQLTPIQQLDQMLSFITKKYGDPNEEKYLPKQYSSVLAHYQMIEPSSENYDLMKVLDKLLKDGHIAKTQHIVEYLYSVTFEGELFIEAGGYAAQLESERLRNAAIITDLEARKRNDRRLVCGTFLAGFGALALVIWDLYKTLYLNCK